MHIKSLDGVQLIPLVAAPPGACRPNHESNMLPEVRCQVYKLAYQVFINLTYVFI